MPALVFRHSRKNGNDERENRLPLVNNPLHLAHGPGDIAFGPEGNSGGDTDGGFDVVTSKDALYDERSLIKNRVSTLFSKCITLRETQVVAQVLEGYSSISIAKNLGISVGTVRIHRRNVHAKLKISSQQELFSIFFKSITTER